jgi:hypothetical protein
MRCSLANSTPVSPLREILLLRVQRGEATLCGSAAELDWKKSAHTRKGERIGDKSRLERFLGMRECSAPANKRISYDLAVHCCRRLNIDPVDIGV